MARDAITVPFDIEVDTASTDKSITKVAEMLEEKIGGSIDKFVIRKFSDVKNEASLLVKSGDKFYQTMIKLNKTGSLNQRNLKSKTSESFKSTLYGDSFSLFGKITTKADAKQFIKAANDNLKIEQAEAAALKKQADIQNRYNTSLGAQGILKGLIPSKEIAQIQLDSLLPKLNELKRELVDIASSGGDLTKTANEFNKLNEQVKKLQKETSKSGIQKFLERFKAFATTRLFRNFFRFLESGFNKGIQNLAQFDSSANETMSKLTSSLSTVFNSIAVAIIPIIETITPIIERLSSIVAEISNYISKTVAKSKGLTTYTKVNADYMKDFADAANSATLSFDKFESLSGDRQDNMFVEASVSEEDTSSQIEILGVINELIAALAIIEGYKIIKWITDENGLKKTFKELKDGLTSIKDKITNISSANMILMSTLGFITSVIQLINLLKNWNTASLISKITGITAAVAGVASVVFTILALTGVGSAKVMKAIATGLGAAATLLAGASALTISMKADGGMVDKGTLFIAGEAGPELVSSMPSGQTGVTNIAQFKQAMLEALYEWGGSQDGGSVILNLDGAEIARSKRFVSELNRKNSGLNLI